ncbi:MAG: futalosine hydrolase [Bacteroidales bacterium]|nr:futalosine hydrolase [Bacteroidales bacterium]
MRILFTAAVPEELQQAQKAYMELPAELRARFDVAFAVTGIGAMNTCYKTTKLIQPNPESKKFDLVVNVGIAGSYTQKYSLGIVVNVIVEQFGDIGVETRNGFQTIFDYDTLNANTYPFIDGLLKSRSLPNRVSVTLVDLPKVAGITVQTVSGRKETNKERFRIFSPEVESMEGAAFFYVCLMEGIPFIEIRAISNYVGERDKSKWEIPFALKNLSEVCKDIFTRL